MHLLMTAHRELLTTTIGGARMCISLLDRLAALFDAEESSDESRAFDIGYGILRQLIEEGLIASGIAKLRAVSDTPSDREEEAITPHQTTLLKLLDSYLQSSACAHDFPSARRRTEDGDELLRMLSHTFLLLSSYVQGSIERSLGPRTANSGDTTKLHVADQEAGSPRAESDAIDHAAPSSGSDSSPLAPQELDLLLPKVCEALVLVTQCLTSITLRAEEAECTYTRSAGPEAQLGAPLSPKQVLATAVTSDGRGLVEILTGAWRTNEYARPRIHTSAWPEVLITHPHDRNIASS
ncbi:hypothetical protein A0H81_05856 [Grifola frondosa]|uniref:Uncharacterized protein n=1 Tax=Grifola frondosa TaxID=5627 RepID=A0A1C7MBA2_GRIFR|nr:hypothetical protein A0H81_05856 [Grifola frondosa]